ncbi:MAG: hypothetical protein GF401_16315 [Chitinivibrionales bacterium]|nr:hypothetical protein [Chitinivibrionales bacterium]
MKTQILIAVVALVIGPSCGTDDGIGRRSACSSKSILSGKIASAQSSFTPDGAGEITDDMREMAVDLVAYNGCDYLKNTFFTLVEKYGATSSGDASPTVGTFMIRSCSISQVDSYHMDIEISGIGWRWVSRTRSRAGAEFALNENVKFQATMVTTGTVNMVYDQQENIATAYFAPTAPVDIGFNVTADIDIHSEELWSSIMGTAASIIGASPEKRSRQSIRQVFSRHFQSRLNQGFTFIIDLCTGRRYTRFGTFPPGEIPPSATPERGMNFQINTAAELHAGSLLMAGPYATKKVLVAEFTIDKGGPVTAQWICRKDAKSIAEAYVYNRPLPGIRPIKQKIVGRGKNIHFPISPKTDCPVVLLMEPLEEDQATTSFVYQVYYEGDVTRPLTECKN